ncbi:MAG TPA: hypothetical protein V6D02_06255 [Candidatus Obscuribacterales bacterium]
MASVQKVQTYLAYWFQLGKPVVFEKSQTQCLPTPIFEGHRLSLAFEQCWQRILAHAPECFLSGTNESIADLLTDAWEIDGCSRCTMPVPLLVQGIKLSPCPCADLPSWPNDEVPQPREAVCSTHHLTSIRERLNERSQPDRDRLQSAYHHSPNLPGATAKAFGTPQEATKEADS